MSELNGTTTSSLNARPSAPLNTAAKVSQNSGQPLPTQTVEKAGPAIVLPSVSSDTKAQEETVEIKATQASEAEELELAVAKLNDYVQQTERKLNFQVDEESGLTVIRVFDKQSDELIRQIPSEEVVSLAQKLNQEEPLMLFSAQV
ncbi:flagellar protein FlaG [Saccharospirillum mangrovi]|uniref:flagellar protein FlaG n=1 Tax=Saccharospirillum mangrovi TaxID=2161747 RepID=UPI000D3A0634|nr:flagellar protein FlaG [Saccharospirillum mangrovi]